MKYVSVVCLGVVALFAISRCTKESESYTPPTPTVLEQNGIGETGLIHSEDVFYEAGSYWFEAPEQTTIPDEWDLRNQTTTPVPVGDQGNCGSCWAYSSHQALEWYRVVNFKDLAELSAQTLLSCSDIDAQNWGCSGGTMGVVSFLKRGLPLESDFRYQARKVACKFSREQIEAGWSNRVIETPWVGESLSRSRYWKLSGKTYESQRQVEAIQKAQVALNSPAIVTVAAYSASGNGVVRSCKAKNSGGNHMVVNIGWDKEGGTVNAHNFNSWGTGHGENGTSRLQWTDSSGNLCYGYGIAARVLRSDLVPPCDPPKNPELKPEEIIFSGSKVEIGKAQEGVTCKWSPAIGLKDPNACVTDASPTKTTEYHVEIKNDCGKVTAMTLIRVFSQVVEGDGRARSVESREIVTPFGEVAR